VLAYLDVPLLGQPEVFVQFKDDGPVDAEGNITVQSTRKFLQDFVDRYVQWLHTMLKR
jgi:chromate reductase, NAD(P)H dehydrogenase (quinone)